MQAADMARRGRTLMVFTITTVISFRCPPSCFLCACHQGFSARSTSAPRATSGLRLQVRLRRWFCHRIAERPPRPGLGEASNVFKRGREKEWHLMHSKRCAQARAGQGSSGTDGERVSS